MQKNKRLTKWIRILVLLGGCGSAAFAANGRLSGTVTIAGTGFGAHHATVLISPLGITTLTDEAGHYSVDGLPPGRYEIIAHLHALTDERKTIALAEGQMATVDFDLRLSPLRQELTVTASGTESTVYDAFQSVATMDSIQLKEKTAFGLGEVLDRQLGVAKRSFGPGSSRPILRGFDGDRVLILQDGLPTGTLSSQSGEHGEPVDAADLERIEVVKGPASLLYGSGAIGGVVNSVTEHHMFHEHAHEGLRGHFSTGGGSNNRQAGASGSFEYGYRNWMAWGTAGRQVAGDYYSPEGRVENSKTRLTSGSFGWGWFGAKPFVNLTYSTNRGRFGVPYAGHFHGSHGEERNETGKIGTHGLFRAAEAEAREEEIETEAQVDEVFRWQNLRWNGGFRDLSGLFPRVHFSAAYTLWNHREVENGDYAATDFRNRLLQLRGIFDQRPAGPWKGSWGFQVVSRKYRATGEEALSPPVDQGGLALFGLQEFDFQKAKFQVAGRVDHTGYDPHGGSRKSFTGFSGAAGVRLPLGRQGSLVASYNHAFRAPALEELFNYGPHVGNMAFEIGNSNLQKEAGNGVELSLRRDSSRVRGEWNLFLYRIGDFVYMSPTGEFRNGLQVVNFLQKDSRFLGSEARLDLGVHPLFWLNLGFDAVRARLEEGASLPRIPPFRSRIGFDFRTGGFSLRPELVLAGAQKRVFENETPTAGYGVVHLTASYTLPARHYLQVISVSTYNLNDRLYRNHCSFLKELAPEAGRGIRLNYSLHFF